MRAGRRPLATSTFAELAFNAGEVLELHKVRTSPPRKSLDGTIGRHEPRRLYASCTARGVSPLSASLHVAGSYCASLRATICISSHRVERAVDCTRTARHLGDVARSSASISSSSSCESRCIAEPHKTLRCVKVENVS